MNSQYTKPFVNEYIELIQRRYKQGGKNKMNKEWSEKNKQIQILLGKETTYKDGIELLIMGLVIKTGAEISSIRRSHAEMEKDVLNEGYKETK